MHSSVLDLFASSKSQTRRFNWPAFPLAASQHRAKGSDDPYKEIDGIATTRYSVGGLSPYSHYDFRVAAVNTIGQGPSSDVVEARTAEQAPSSPPRQVRRCTSCSSFRNKKDTSENI